MSNMSNISTIVSLAFSGRKPEPLVNIANLKELKTQYENQDHETHWFSKETLEFFGSADLKLYLPGITIENQLNAPEGIDRYAVTAWVIYEDSGRITPTFIERFASLEEAESFAYVIYSSWNQFAEFTAL